MNIKIILLIIPIIVLISYIIINYLYKNKEYFSITAISENNYITDYNSSNPSYAGLYDDRKIFNDKTSNLYNINTNIWSNLANDLFDTYQVSKKYDSSNNSNYLYYSSSNIDNIIITSNMSNYIPEFEDIYREIYWSNNIKYNNNINNNIVYNSNVLESRMFNTSPKIPYSPSEVRYIPMPEKKITTSNIVYNPIIETNKDAKPPEAIDYAFNYKLNSKTLNDPITDEYLPYSSNIFSLDIHSPEYINNQYIIINIYKTILDRQPTTEELIKNSTLFANNELDAITLKMQLLNSRENTINIKMQSNEIEPELEYAFARENLLYQISIIYFNELHKEAPPHILLPLKDIYIYLQYNSYLLRALLIHKDYILFENDVINNKVLTKSKLLDYFNKYFNLYELKIMAQDIKKEIF